MAKPASEWSLDEELSNAWERANGAAFERPRFLTLISEIDRHNAYVALTRQLGPRYSKCSFRNFDVQKADIGESNRARHAKLMLAGYADDMPAKLSGGGIVLYGPPGAGKDHLMCAMMFTAIFRWGIYCQWVNGMDLYGELRDAITNESAEKSIISKYQEPAVLVISDPIPPKGDVTRYNAETLYRIIDRRYRFLRPTWATLNVEGGDEASNRLAANIVDRLRHNSLCIHCDWSSYRRAAV